MPDMKRYIQSQEGSDRARLIADQVDMTNPIRGCHRRNRRTGHIVGLESGVSVSRPQTPGQPDFRVARRHRVIDQDVDIQVVNNQGAFMSYVPSQIDNSLDWRIELFAGQDVGKDDAGFENTVPRTPVRGRERSHPQESATVGRNRRDQEVIRFPPG